MIQWIATGRRGSDEFGPATQSLDSGLVTVDIFNFFISPRDTTGSWFFAVSGGTCCHAWFFKGRATSCNWGWVMTFTVQTGYIMVHPFFGVKHTWMRCGKLMKAVNVSDVFPMLFMLMPWQVTAGRLGLFFGVLIGIQYKLICVRNLARGSVPRLSLRFYSLTPTFVKYDGSTNRKWHRSLWIWLQQVWQRWWAEHLSAEDVTMHQERVASHLKKMLQRIRNIWQVTVRRADTCIRKVVQFTYK